MPDETITDARARDIEAIALSLIAQAGSSTNAPTSVGMETWPGARIFPKWVDHYNRASLMVRITSEAAPRFIDGRLRFGGGGPVLPVVTEEEYAHEFAREAMDAIDRWKTQP